MGCAPLGGNEMRIEILEIERNLTLSRIFLKVIAYTVYIAALSWLIGHFCPKGSW